MARLLSHTEREVIASALEAHADQLAEAGTTGNAAVDRIVTQQRDSASDLAAAYRDAHRASLSLAGDPEEEA